MRLAQLAGNFSHQETTIIVKKLHVVQAPYTIYMELSLDKNFTEPSYLYIAEKIGGFRTNFRQCGKGRHILCAIINRGQKISVINFSPGGETAKIPLTYMVSRA